MATPLVGQPGTGLSVSRATLAKYAKQFQTISLLTMVLFGCLQYAYAILGKPEKDITQEIASLGLQKTQETRLRGYIYRVLSSKDLVVGEYVDPKSKLVFGVTWRGTRMPDLLTLLGVDPTKLTGPAVYQTLHQSRIETRTLFYEAGGHMGFYVGRAIRTDLLPKGISRFEIKP